MSAARDVRVLLPTGLGVNCEAETAEAFRLLGVEPEFVPLTDLLHHRAGVRLADYRLMVLMGGFSYGDHVAGGFVLAMRMRARLREELSEFLREGGLALGICNGFQVLVRLGLLPGPDAGEHDFVPRAALASNDRLGYRDAWVRLGVDERARTPWLKGISALELPSRHGEGKFLVEDGPTLDRLDAEGRLVLRYLDPQGAPTERWPHNPSGSPRGVAGVTDHSGRVLGLMPHPDAFVYGWQHPRARHDRDVDAEIPPAGLTLFRAGLEAAREAR